MVLLKPLALLLVALICADVQGTRETALNDTIPRLDTTENYLVGRTGECLDSDRHLQRGPTFTLYGQHRHSFCREKCDVDGACTAYATQESTVKTQEPTCILYYGAVVQGSGVWGYTCYIKIPTESATCVDIAPPRLWGNPTCELQLRNTNHCAERLAGTLQDYFCYSTCGVCSPRAANHTSSNSSLIGSSESRNLTGFWNSSLIGLCEECVDDEMCEEGLVCHERKPFDTLPPRCALPPGTFDPRVARSRKYCAPSALPDKGEVDAAACPKGWEEKDGFCWKIVNEVGTTDFSEAKFECARVGGSLPEPKTDALRLTMGYFTGPMVAFQNPWWVGASNVGTGIWKWQSDGSNLTDAEMDFFRSGTPGSDSNAIMVMSDYYFCYTPEHSTQYAAKVLCQRDAGPTEDPSEAPTVSVEVGCDETLSEAGYKGCQNTTWSGRTCQKWTRQSPHRHSRVPEAFPGKNLGDHNYCRNPDDEPEGIWCYTTDPDTRWEYCDPISDETEQEAAAPIGDPVNSFTVGKLACYYQNSPAITQYFSSRGVDDHDYKLLSLLTIAFYGAFTLQYATTVVPEKSEDDDTAVTPSTFFIPYNLTGPVLNIKPEGLLYHVIWGRTVYANMLDTRETWSSPLTRSRPLRVSRDENGDLLLDCHAKIDLMDIETCLGIVHVIDRNLDHDFDHCATNKTNNSTINTDGIADSNIFGADVSPLTGQGEEEKQAATDTKRALLDQVPRFYFVVAPLLLLGFVVVSVVLTRHWLKLRTLKKRGNALNTSFDDIECADTTALQRRIWEWIDSKELLFVQKLGGGGAGVVYYAKWRSTDVAVKVLGPEGRKHTNKLSYSELDTLCLCRHPNILSLYGVAGDREGGEMWIHPRETSPVASPRMAFVTELACCSLADLLVEGFQRTATIQDLLSMAQGVAAGLEYLHNREKGFKAICHMDIKPGNILIKHGMCPCIGDFGSALVGAHRRPMADLTGLMLTPGYIAPELIKASQCTATIDTLAVDVFAYGLVLKHMFTSSPIEMSHLVEDQWDRAKMRRNPEEKLAEQVMPELPQSAVQMMSSMLAWEPSARPTISTIAQVLATALQQSSAGDAQSSTSSSTRSTRSPLLYDYPGTKSKFQTDADSTGVTLELTSIAQAMFDTASITTSAGLLEYQSSHEHTSVPFGPTLLSGYSSSSRTCEDIGSSSHSI